MDYRFGAARDLYAANVHPRVCLGPDDVVSLREKIRSGEGRKIMSALRRKVRHVVSFVLESDDLAALLKGDGSHNCPAALIGYGIDDVAMVAALDEDDLTLEAMRRLFDTVCSPSYQGGRLGAPGLAKPYDILYPHLSVGQRRAYTRVAQKAVRGAIDATAATFFKCAGGNQTLGSTLSAVPIILAITGEPGVRRLDGQLDYLLTCFEATLHSAIRPDGYPEEDIGYGTGVTAWLGQLAEWLRRAGVYDAYEACPRLARFGQAMLHFVQPWGEDLSNTGDHGDDFGLREFILARLAAETNAPTLLWLLGTLSYHHGKVHPENRLPEFYIETPLRKGFRTPASHTSLLVLDELRGEVHPAKVKTPTQFRDRGRGIVSLRSGWKAEDTFVVFDGSQRSSSGQGHAHASCGHFSLSALGEYFSIDTGRYNNEQSCHSVVLIDGKSGRSTDGEWTAVKHHGLLTDYEPGEFVDFAGVDSSLQHNCCWAKRYLGLVKGPGAPAWVWTVDDINKHDAWARFWWQMQTSPENTIKLHKSHATITGHRHGNRLDVHFALPTPHEYPRPHEIALAQDLGTASSYKYLRGDPSNHGGRYPSLQHHVKRYERPADMVHGPVYVRPRLLAKVGGWNGRMMAVMVPRAKGQRPCSVKRLKCLDGSIAVRLTFPEVEDTLVFAFDHSLLRAGDVEGRGQWCVVRRSRRSGRVLRHALACGGTSLAVAGRELPVAGDPAVIQ